jgi:acetyl esterase/lipase
MYSYNLFFNILTISATILTPISILFRKIEGHLKEPLISPLIADDETLEGLPFTYIMTCGFDFIRDDGIMFHEKLKHLKVDTELAHYPEGFHNALMFPHGPLKMELGKCIYPFGVSICSKIHLCHKTNS